MRSRSGIRFLPPALVFASITLCGLAAEPRPTRPPSSTPAGAGSPSPLAPIPQARIIPGVTALHGELWVIGGHVARTRTTAAVSVYSLIHNRWKPGPELPSPLSTTAVAVLGDECFVIGGNGSDGVLLDTVFSSSTSQPAWRPRAALPAPRFQTCAVTVSGRLYVAGGGGHELRDRVQGRELLEYLVAENRWIRRAPMPEPMRNAAAVAMNDQLYIVGGHSFTDSRRGSNLLQRYDPRTDTWSACAAMPTPRTDLAAVVYNQRIFVLGGHPNLDVVESYDPTADSWRTEKPLPEGRMFHGAVATSDGIYVVGGLPDHFYLYRP